MKPRPPSCPLFPCTTLFRSELERLLEGGGGLGPLAGGEIRLSAQRVDVRGARLEAGRRLEVDRRVVVLPLLHRDGAEAGRSEEHTSELQSLVYAVCRLLHEK